MPYLCVEGGGDFVFVTNLLAFLAPSLMFLGPLVLMETKAGS